MVAKFNLRWTFYRIVVFACGAKGRKLKEIRKVVNPRKISKVDKVARRHRLNPRICRSWATRRNFTICVNKIKIPNIIGIYGFPGTGKTTLLSQLRQTTETWLEKYDYYKGFKIINSVVDGGLTAFKKLPHIDKQRHRATAVKQIGRDACNNGKSALVAGHFILPNDNLDGGLQKVYIKADLETFTHIIYLKVPAEDICK
ncbi:hypothetical protein PoMZ_09265 [Pyricularia oryzae]|uniref:Uncharacterized protein n=1 Tax=Pyricularia oryzae TaxID=318829 RepID=A0A4P7MTK9_PYROR|nr:hypothetical protein PoMZ_09265 [Pyricularia oryzae]